MGLSSMIRDIFQATTQPFTLHARGSKAPNAATSKRRLFLTHRERLAKPITNVRHLCPKERQKRLELLLLLHQPPWKVQELFCAELLQLKTRTPSWFGRGWKCHAHGTAHEKRGALKWQGAVFQDTLP